MTTKKLLKGIVVGLIFLTVGIVACAPRSAPAPSVPTPAAAASVSGPASNLQPIRQAQGMPLTSQDAAWAKVVEAGKKEGLLIVYSFSMIGDTGTKVSKAFFDKYGISVDIISGRGAEFLERVKTERRNGQVMASVIDSSSTHLINMKKAGLLEGASDLPALRDKTVWSVDPLIYGADAHVIGARVQTYYSWVNTRVVPSGQEPGSYRDLLQPRWKGKLGVGDPRLSEGSYATFVTLLRRGLISVETVRELGQQNLQYYTGSNDGFRALIKGEIAAALGYTEINASGFIREGAPVKAVALEEGSVVQLSSAALIKEGPKPNAARLFLNWLISQDGQSLYIKETGVASVRNDVPEFRPPAAVAQNKKLVVMTEADADESASKFADKYLAQLWQR